MSPSQIAALKDVATRGLGREPEIPELLTTEERDAMSECIRRNVRIEQEHVPQALLLRAMAAMDRQFDRQG